MTAADATCSVSAVDSTVSAVSSTRPSRPGRLFLRRRPMTAIPQGKILTAE